MSTRNANAADAGVCMAESHRSLAVEQAQAHALISIAASLRELVACARVLAGVSTPSQAREALGEPPRAEGPELVELKVRMDLETPHTTPGQMAPRPKRREGG